MKKKLIYLLCFAFLQGCCFCDEPVEVESQKNPVLEFAVAGHAYGDPDHYTWSVYPPFLEKFEAEQKERPVDYLFLTGDVVKHSVDTVWEVVIDELNALGVPWFIAPGNHDIGPEAEYMGGQFIEIAANDTTYDKGCVYYDRSTHKIDTWFLGEGWTGVKGNYLLVLNTSNPGWTPDSLHKAHLENFMENLHRDSVDNIFVLTHQPWWDRNTPSWSGLDSIMPNSGALYDGPSDFWTDAFPLFEKKGIETWFFAGDLGATLTYPYYYEDHFKHFHFYASGMGGGVADNYLRVSVYENGDVQIERIDF